MTEQQILKMTEGKSTPFYLYDLNLLKETLECAKQEAHKYDFHLHYALKANFSEPILPIISSYEFGADCVSGQEIALAIKSGFSENKIVFAGVGKTDKEINLALDYGIFCFNCESLQEIEVINELAANRKQIATIAIRINPNIDAHTHHYITTGLEENKFGINLSELPLVLAKINHFKYINLKGIHLHIGSQIMDLAPFKELCEKINTLQKTYPAFDFINVGGGLGIDYLNPEKNQIADFKNYFAVFNHHLKRRPDQAVHFELGRSIVGQCGSLISRVLYVKPGINNDFVIIDAGMSHLIRPALYQVEHKIKNLNGNSLRKKQYNVAGPICESTDIFAKNLSLPETYRGDILQIMSAGAYGEVMASHYNLKPLFPAVFFED